ncbi:MAG: peroxide stress protein YaaA [Gammaproteobacteria bacterium]|nr:peroxide stress protein YaaA [Gammaproteobacteria bacterium]MCF6229830.1 peroxide stress protein YaaA [Gammaproteobacteria bacterium]
MLIVISPAKTLDYQTPATTLQYSQNDYLQEAQQLIERLRHYSVADISATMAVSEKIARMNATRFKQWQIPFTLNNSKQAILAFKGEVYSGLNATSFSEEEFQFAQQHLRILSGLYGLLRPLDLMQPYRLEMGRKIDTERGSNLYHFWGNVITTGINRQMQLNHSTQLINLASNEYFKSIKPSLINGEVITPHFKDYKNGRYKVMGVYAKKARGKMSRYIIKNRVDSAEELKHFTEDGYRFNPALSQESDWVFTRNREAL